MHNDTENQLAASSKKAGYSFKTTSIPDLAGAWLAYCSDPDSSQARECLAVRLDESLRSRLPLGGCTGILAGHEEDIRQEAYLLLVGRFLAGNAGLMTATAAGDVAKIDNQIRKSANGSIRAVLRTMLRSLARHHEVHEYGVDVDACPQADCIHPAVRTSLWELPFELQCKLVFAALRKAVVDKKLPARAADLAIKMVDGGISQSAVAAALGVTRQSIHQSIALVRRLISALVEAEEFPIK